jgi:hypothetical protein
MNGLRVFINPRPTDATTVSVFYTRRANGPYYRWLYEEQVGKWRGSRVIDANLMPQPLSMATWKTVPPGLQKSLSEHYME